VTLRLDLRTSTATLALSARTARELLETLRGIRRRLDETTLERWLHELERQQLAECRSDGRWTLSVPAMRALGGVLSLSERSEIREASE
jgi:hypothetical protein